MRQTHRRTFVGITTRTKDQSVLLSCVHATQKINGLHHFIDVYTKTKAAQQDQTTDIDVLGAKMIQHGFILQIIRSFQVRHPNLIFLAFWMSLSCCMYVCMRWENKQGQTFFFFSIFDDFFQGRLDGTRGNSGKLINKRAK